MPISMTCRGTPDRIEWQVARNDPVLYVLYSEIQGNPGNAKHMERMQEAVQARLDTPISFMDLPADEELLTKDPGSDPRLLGRMWWGDADGKKVELPTHLVSRAVVVTILSWDGEKYICQTARA